MEKKIKAYKKKAMTKSIFIYDINKCHRHCAEMRVKARGVLKIYFEQNMSDLNGNKP